MSKLAGKVALVSGGTSGIGAAVAKLFAAEGTSVVATGSNPATVEQARGELAGVEVVACDAADVAAVGALVTGIAAEHGRAEILVVNAGVAPYATLEQADPAFFDHTFTVNARGAFFLMKEAARVMPDGGAMLLTASIGHAMGMPGQSVYCASKAALRSLGRTFAAELAPHGIHINTISPGPVATPIWGKVSGASEAQVGTMQDQVAAKVPLRRIGRPEDIAAAALFLAADALYTTGVDLPIDDGLLDIGYSAALQLS